MAFINGDNKLFITQVLINSFIPFLFVFGSHATVVNNMFSQEACFSITAWKFKDFSINDLLMSVQLATIVQNLAAWQEIFLSLISKFCNNEGYIGSSYLKMNKKQLLVNLSLRYPNKNQSILCWPTLILDDRNLEQYQNTHTFVLDIE